MAGSGADLAEQQEEEKGWFKFHWRTERKARREIFRLMHILVKVVFFCKAQVGMDVIKNNEVFLSSIKKPFFVLGIWT